MHARPIGYLGAALASAMIIVVAQQLSLTWPVVVAGYGDQLLPMRALTGHLVNLPQILLDMTLLSTITAVFALPFFAAACLTSSVLRSRSPLIYLAFGAAAAIASLAMGSMLLFPDESATPLQAFVSGMPVWLASGVIGAAVYWAISERDRPRSPIGQSDLRSKA